jgi:hypothetical protein
VLLTTFSSSTVSSCHSFFWYSSRHLSIAGLDRHASSSHALSMVRDDFESKIRIMTGRARAREPPGLGHCTVSARYLYGICSVLYDDDDHEMARIRAGLREDFRSKTCVCERGAEFLPCRAPPDAQNHATRPTHARAQLEGSLHSLTHVTIRSWATRDRPCRRL